MTRCGDFFEAYRCTYSWMGSGDSTFKQELHTATQGRAPHISIRCE